MVLPYYELDMCMSAFSTIEIYSRQVHAELFESPDGVLWDTHAHTLLNHEPHILEFQHTDSVDWIGVCEVDLHAFVSGGARGAWAIFKDELGRGIAIVNVKFT